MGIGNMCFRLLLLLFDLCKEECGVESAQSVTGDGHEMRPATAMQRDIVRRKLSTDKLTFMV